MQRRRGVTAWPVGGRLGGHVKLEWRVRWYRMWEGLRSHTESLEGWAEASILRKMRSPGRA